MGTEPTPEIVDERLVHPGPTAITRAVDAQSGDLRSADLAFVFGTTLSEPVELCAELLLERQLVPAVVVTGGPHRNQPEHVESEAHARALMDRGVPPDALIVERRSQTTTQNVVYARRLIEDQIGQVTSVIAVVKWYHRRAVLTLVNHLPSVSRVYTVTYEPRLDTGQPPLARTNWASSPYAPRVIKEYEYLRRLERAPNLVPIVRRNGAWIRSEATSLA